MSALALSQSGYLTFQAYQSLGRECHLPDFLQGVTPTFPCIIRVEGETLSRRMGFSAAGGTETRSPDSTCCCIGSRGASYSGNGTLC